MRLGREVVARRLLAAAAWVLATLAAGTVAWGAVSRLGNEGAANAGDPLSPAQVQEALQRNPARSAPTTPSPARSAGSDTSARTRPDAGPSASRGTAARPSGVPASPQASSGTTRQTRSWQLVGGTVGAACRGSTIDLLYSVPRDGWAQSVEQSGPTNVVVAFTRGNASSRLVAACSNGSPTAQAGTGYVQGTSGSGPSDSGDPSEPETSD